MKKIVLVAAMVATCFTSALAQNTTLTNSKLTDNWYLGVNGGAVTPLDGAFFGNMRPTVGLEVGRYFTPIFGLGVEGRAKFNTTASHTSVDQAYALLLGKLNLNNLFFGYKGEPRAFEVVALAGTGFEHQFGGIADKNYMAYKAGMEFNYNIGEAKAWQINVKPAIVWDLDRTVLVSDKLDKHAATFEINAGVTYKFSCSNGTHNFALAKTYDQTEVNNLNSSINSLRKDLNAKDARVKECEATIADLQNALKDCQNKAPQVVEKQTSTMTLESVVTFAQGKTVIAASQLPNVERIATYLKNHKDAKVIIKGFASPEGSVEINNKIALARATSVKSMLMSKYKIAEGRISAEGQGIGNMFSEPDWNRVSICTIDESSEK